MGKRNNNMIIHLNRLEDLVVNLKSDLSDIIIKDFEELIGEMKASMVELEDNNDQIAETKGQRERSDYHVKLLDDAPMGYVEVDESLSIQFVNKLFASIFMVDSQDFVGKVITSYIDPDFKEQFLHLIKRVKNQRSKSSLIVKLNSEKDNYSKLECNIDQNGDQLTFRIAFIDVTREVINEQQLIESRERYKAVADYAYHWEYWLDPTGQLLYMSPSCERITGYSKFDFFDNLNSLDKIIHPDDKQAFIAHQSLSKTNSETSTECKIDFRIIRRDGEVRWLNHVCVNIFKDDGKPLGIRVTNKDITEQKEFETALKLSEQKLLESNNRVSAILETLPDLIFIISNDGVYLDFYASDESLLFVKPDVFLGRSIRDILPSELAEKNEKALKRVFKTGEQQYITYSLEQDNEIKYFEVRIVKYTHDSALAIVRDISGQKRGEQIIARNELYLKTILQTSVDGFWIVGLNGKFLEVNQSYCRMSGYTREEILNLSIHDIDVLEDANQVYRHVRDIVNSGSEIFETKHRRKDGTIFDVEVSVTYLKFNNEQIICFIRDISERKKADLELQKSHKSIMFLAEKALSFVEITNLNEFYDFIGESVYELYPNAFIMVNSVNIKESYLVTEKVYGEKGVIKKVVDLLGYNLIGKRHTIKTSFLKSGDGKLVKVEGGIYEFTLGNVSKELVPSIERLLDVNTIYGIAVLFNNQIVCSVGMVFPRGSNIDKVYTLETLIKQASIAYNRIIAEENLLNEQERFKLSMEATNDGLWDWNVITDHTYFSPAYFTMLGFEVGGFPSNGETWKKMIHPEDVDDTLKVVQNSINGAGDSFEVEFRMKTAEDRWKWILGRGKVIERNKKGKAIRVVGTHMDITERKVFEETLRKRNSFIQTVLDNLPIGIALNKVNEGTAIYMNKRFVEIYGWPEEEMRDIASFFNKVYPDPDYRKELMERIMADIRSGDPERMRWNNIRVTQGNGDVRIINAVNIPLFEQNTMVSTVIDVTDQKEFEQALRESESRFKALHNASFGGIVIHDKGLILDCNKGLSEITGYSLEELVGMNGLLLIAEETREMVLSNILAGYEKPYEAMGVRKDGSKYPLSLEARNIPYKGKQVRVVEFRDITDAKNAEQALRNSEERFRMLAELAPVGIIITDENQNPAYVSPTFTKIFGYTKKDIPTAAHWFKLAYPDEQYRNEVIKEWVQYTELAKNGRGDLYPMEQTVYCLDGSYKQIEFRLAVSGSIQVIVFTDITERKLAEHALRESEERYRKLYKETPAMLHSIDNEGRLISVSNTWLQKLGYTKEEVIGRKSTDFLTEESKRMAVEVYLPEFFKKGFSENVYYQMVTREGEILDVLMSAVAEKSASKGFVRSMAVIEDITERKQAEKALRESEERFRGLYENATVGIFRTSPKGQILMANPALVKMLGYSSFDDLSKRNLSEEGYEAGYTRSEFKKIIEERGEVLGLESAWTTKNGETIYISESARVIRDEDGNPIYYEGIVEDITKRKMAIDALRASEERISSIFRVAPIGIGVVVNRVLTEVNQTICDIIGYSKEELIGKSAQILYPTKEEFEKVGKEKYRQISEKGTGTVETQWKRKDGSIINILLSSTPIAQNDLLLGVTFTALDITERKQNERLMKGRLKLLEFADTSSLSELLKETLAVAEDLTGSQIGFYHFIDEAKGQIILNQWSERTEKELCKLTENFEKHYPIERAGVWVECIKRRKPIIHNNYDSLPNKKGMPEGHVSLKRELTVPVFRNKSIVAVLGIGNKETNYTKTDIEIIAQLADMAWDIVEQKMAQEQVIKLTKGIDQSPAIVVITDTNGTIEYVNPKFSEVTGYSLNEVLGQNPRLLKSGHQGIAFYQNMWNTILSGNDWQGDMLNLKKNGEFYWESALISPIKNERGEIKHFIAIKEDITERKRAEEALIQSEYILKEKNEEYLALNEELTESNQRIIKINQDLMAAREKAEESDKLKTAFLANMSHEIRTPMNAIIGFSEMLLNPTLEKEKRTFFTQILNTSCHQLLSVVEDVIDIAKIETGQMDVVLGKTNLNHVISRVQSIFLPQTLNREVEILTSYSLPDDLAYIHTDTNKLNQILTNLVSNALKFTEKGSVHISYRVENDYVEFCVKDAGIGIKQEYHEVIFERFRQVELESTRKYGGTGLGLPISKAFIEALGGRIWVQSDIGKGSSFFFTLPYKAVIENNVEKAGSIMPHVSLSGKVVLVAEDEDANFILISEIIEDSGGKVIRAENGKLAVDIFQSGSQIDLILMDIKMPEMNGIEATKRIKELDKSIPIIALTAYAFSDDRVKCIAAGCSEYLSKPVTKNELLSILSTYIA